ncbi:hypothetical protein GWI34_17495 [Actinomadura sp. DSM 109109]|nr:hypothetical protein [Actinomadura lepetitiana]
MSKIFGRKPRPSQEPHTSRQCPDEALTHYQAPPGTHVDDAVQWALARAKDEGPIILAINDGETLVLPDADPAAVAAEAYENMR